MPLILELYLRGDSIDLVKGHQRLGCEMRVISFHGTVGLRTSLSSTSTTSLVVATPTGAPLVLDKVKGLSFGGNGYLFRVLSTNCFDSVC